MPSKSFYYQTSDGCLERNRQGYQTLPIFTSAEYPSAEFDYKFSTADYDTSLDSSGLLDDILDSPIEDGSSVDGCDANGRQWQETSGNQLIGGMPNQIFLDDAAMDLDENRLSHIVVQDFEASSLETEWRDSFHDGLPHTYRPYSSLPRAEEKRLRDFTMAPSAVTAKGVEENVVAPAPPKPKKRVRNKKRKPVQQNEAAEAAKRKCGHNAIEKRYRTNLNDKIMTLRQSIPGLRTPAASEKTGAVDEEFEESSPDAASQNFGKAVILTKAVEYILHLENHIQQFSRNVLCEKARVMAIERLAMSGSIGTSKAAPNRNPFTETLQTIQARFCEVKPSQNETPIHEPDTVRRSKRKVVKTEPMG